MIASPRRAVVRPELDETTCVWCPRALVPTTRTFTATGGLVTARSSHTATLLNDGRVLVTGGGDSNGNYLSSAEVFDPAAGTFAQTGSSMRAPEGVRFPPQTLRVTTMGRMALRGTPVGRFQSGAIKKREHGISFPQQMMSQASVRGRAPGPVQSTIQARLQPSPCHLQPMFADLVVAAVGRTRLLGLVPGHWDVRESAINKVRITHDSSGVNPGIGIVVPALKIFETINQPKLNEVRMAIAKRAAEKNAPSVVSARKSERASEVFTKGDFEDALKKASQKKEPTKYHHQEFSC